MSTKAELWFVVWYIILPADIVEDNIMVRSFIYVLD